MNEHRGADVELTLLGADGTPLADADVVVAQVDHAFRFGCTGFQAIELAAGELDAERRAATEQLLGHWLELFNTATLPFYWGRFEPERGQPDTARLRAAARWFVDRGVRVKGHPLCWHTVSPAWLTELPVDEVREPAGGPDPPRRRRLRRADRRLGRRQRGGDHAGLHRRAERHHAARPGGRPGRADPDDVRGGARDQPRRDAPAQRLRPLGRLRAGHRGEPRGRRPDRRDRHPVAHAPGLVGRRADAGGPRAVRPVRAAAPLDREHARLGRADAGPHRRPQRLAGRRVADDARRRGPPGRGARQPLPDARRPPGRRVDHVVGHPGRRLAQRPDRADPRRRLDEALVRGAARPDQGRVVAAADAAPHRRRRPRPVLRLARRVRGRRPARASAGLRPLYAWAKAEVGRGGDLREQVSSRARSVGSAAGRSRRRRP